MTQEKLGEARDTLAQFFGYGKRFERVSIADRVAQLAPAEILSPRNAQDQSISTAKRLGELAAVQRVLNSRALVGGGSKELKSRVQEARQLSVQRLREKQPYEAAYFSREAQIIHAVLLDNKLEKFGTTEGAIAAWIVRHRGEVQGGVNPREGEGGTTTQEVGRRLRAIDAPTAETLNIMRRAGQRAAAARRRNAEARRLAEANKPPEGQLFPVGPGEGTAARPPIQKQTASYADAKKLDEALASGTVKHEFDKRIGGGLVGGIRQEYENGAKVMAKAREDTGLAAHPGIREDMHDDEAPESARELGALEIDRELGFGVMPEIRHVDSINAFGEDHGEGHVAAWIKGKVAADVGAHIVKDEFKNNAQARLDIERIGALDFISGNTDRHPANFIKGTDGRYYAIDTGLAFDSGRSLGLRSIPLSLLSGKSMNPSIQESILKLTDARLDTILSRAGIPERLRDASKARLSVFKKYAERGVYPNWGPYDFLQYNEDSDLRGELNTAYESYNANRRKS